MSDPHRSVDDSPFGGGAGMVLAPDPVFKAVEAAQPVRPLLLLGPSGQRFDQAMAHELAARPCFSLLCGRFEGVDERVAEHLVDGELSIGDYVLAGGEAAAIVVVEAVARLVPGVVGNELGIVARRARLVVFCEVKARTSEVFGLPAEAVGPVKQAKLRRLAALWFADGARENAVGLRENAVGARENAVGARENAVGARENGSSRGRGGPVRFDVASVMGGEVEVIEGAF